MMKCLFRRHKFRRCWDQVITPDFIARHVKCKRCQLRAVIVWGPKESYTNPGKRPRFKR